MCFGIADDSDRNDRSSRPSRGLDIAAPVKWPELVSLIEGLIEGLWAFRKDGDQSLAFEQRRELSPVSKASVMFDRKSDEIIRKPTKVALGRMIEPKRRAQHESIPREHACSIAYEEARSVGRDSFESAGESAKPMAIERLQPCRWWTFDVPLRRNLSHLRGRGPGFEAQRRRCARSRPPQWRSLRSCGLESNDGPRRHRNRGASLVSRTTGFRVERALE